MGEPGKALSGCDDTIATRPPKEPSEFIGQLPEAPTRCRPNELLGGAGAGAIQPSCPVSQCPRSVVQAQRSEVEKLSDPKPSITWLPNELLIRIFDLFLAAARDNDVRRLPGRQLSRTQCLAGVSRGWRGVLLGTASLWTTVLVTPSCGTASVQAHLDRSSQCNLDIEVHSWDSHKEAHEDLFKKLVTMLIPHAHRWHSLAISDDVLQHYLSVILDRLQHMTLASLKRISMPFEDSPFVKASVQSVFFRPEACPRLECLNLSILEVPDAKEFRIPTTVTTVSVRTDVDLSDEELPWIPSFFESLSCSRSQLTSLTLTGIFGISQCHFPPNSIQLPRLEKFVCRVTDARALIEAIVTPSLSHMECYPDITGNPPNNNFTGLESKFTCVHRLILFEFDPVQEGWNSGETEKICLAFPSIRHLTLNNSEAVTMLYLDVATLWQHLECLTIHHTAEDSLDFLDSLLPWLKRRLDVGQPMLTVKFNGWMNEYTIASVQEALHGICTLEWSGINYHQEIENCGTISGGSYLGISEVSDRFTDLASHTGNILSVQSDSDDEDPSELLDL
ncbi:hypothetical protein EDC04DRAFT_3146222 [Pisolithus marmoratus]|nr:hypothetical protein EDC04DRAFT_3146222 [Pisolithus marmoratus]